MGGEREIVHFRLGGYAGVARGNVNGGDFGRLGKLPCKGVFAAAVADDEQFHVLSFGVGEKGSSLKMGLGCGLFQAAFCMAQSSVWAA